MAGVEMIRAVRGRFSERQFCSFESETVMAASAADALAGACIGPIYSP